MSGFCGLFIRRSIFRQTLGTAALSGCPRAGSAVISPSICCPRAFSCTSAHFRKHAGILNGKDTASASQTTDLSQLNIFNDDAVPPISVESLSSGGFRLRNGKLITGGSGLLLVGGEAFAWRPWGELKTLVNAKGQWEVDDSAFGLLSLVWPRPDLLILGVGPEIRPLSPKTKRHITALGMRVEILDTRNAASQFNMLATERGVDDVAAALIPVGWRDGTGAA